MSVFEDVAKFVANGLKSVPKFLRRYAEKGQEISDAVAKWLKSPTVQKAEILLDPVTNGLATEVVEEVTLFAETVNKVLTSVESLDVSDKHKKLIAHALLQKTQSYATALQDGENHKESEYDKASQLVYVKK